MAKQKGEIDEDLSIAKHPLRKVRGADLFKLWLDVRRRPHKRPMSAATAELYESIWTLWLEHLAGLDIPWHLADAETLGGFVSSRSARSHRVDDPSSVTAARYWRIVQDVYAELPLVCSYKSMEQLVELPLGAAKPPEAALSEASSPTFLPAPTLVLLRKSLKQPLPDGPDVRRPWVHVRNRALLAVLLDTAATVRELASLRLVDVFPATGPNGPVLGGVGAGAVKLQSAQPHTLRTLHLSREGARCLTGWLRERADLPCRHQHVFIGAPALRQLTHVSLWRSLSATVAQVLDQAGLQLPYHLGPNMLRNSVLLAWLEAEGRSVEDVTRMGGFKTPRSLARLVAEATEAVRQEYAAALLSHRDGGAGPAHIQAHLSLEGRKP